MKLMNMKMNKYFIYKEVPMTLQTSFIDQLNYEGSLGWEFLQQAQKVDPMIKDFRTGQPKVEIVMILKKELTESEYKLIKNSKGSTNKTYN